jgi:hypothetical protein
MKILSQWPLAVIVVGLVLSIAWFGMLVWLPLHLSGFL